VRWKDAALSEVTGAELVGGGDDGCPHGAVLVRALRPGQTARGVDPKGEAHYDIMAAVSTLFRVVIAACAAASLMVAQSLSFESYRSKVEPIFSKKRPDHARCVVCHSASHSAFHLQPLAAGATTWTEAQSRENFKSVKSLVNVKDPMKSPILVHPLAHEAGGDEFHSGGVQFKDKNDQDWKTIADWVRSAATK